jgi:hypothetical protein
VVVCGALVLALAGACARSASPPEPATRAQAVYNAQTGQLEELVSDRNGDGKIDTRAFMDGTRIVRVEIDRNGDGTTDRWEYYEPTADGGSVIDRAEEANGKGQVITRREFYENGTLVRVEEDTNGDGRTDKWERYVKGRLASVDLDLDGNGVADRRLVYDPSGDGVQVESDPDGDGVFSPVTPPATSTAPTSGTAHQ